MSDKAKVRIGRLNTVGGGVNEMGRVYRQARRDELDDKKAARLVGMLAERYSGRNRAESGLNKWDPHS